MSHNCNCVPNSSCRTSGNCTCESKDTEKKKKLVTAARLRESNCNEPTCNELIKGIMAKKGFFKRPKSLSTKKLAKS